MWDNKLYNDTMSVGGRAANLANIKVPILHAVAEHDHIVPYDAAKHLITKIGSDRQGRGDAEGRSRQPRRRRQRHQAAVAETGFLAGQEIDMSETRSYPRHVKTDAGDIEFRLMSRADEAAVLAFRAKTADA